MENMTTPAVYHDDSYWMEHYNDSNYSGDYYEDGEDEPSSPAYEENKYNIFKSIRIMSVVLLSVVCVLGVLGNGVVIWATGFRMKKTVSTVWYLNLAVADFLVTASLPLKITYRALDGRWLFGRFMCKMDSLVFYVNMYASVFSLVAISVDRCVCVVCPLWARCSGHRTVRKASWVSLGVWVLALAPSIPNVIIRYTGPDPEVVSYPPHMTWCTDDYKYSDEYAFTTIAVIANFVVGFVVPFSVIVSCYSVIIYRLRNNRSLASQSGRSFKIIAAIIASFFLSWAPYHIMRLIIVCYQNGLIEFSDTQGLVIQFGIPITLTLALVNSCVNPLLYVFCQGFKDVFRCRSILKVLEKAFAEEPPQTNNTPTDPAVTRPVIALSEIEGSTAPPGTQDPSGDCPVLETV